MPAKSLHIRPDFVDEDLPEKMREHGCNAFRILSGKSIVHWCLATDVEGAVDNLLQEVERMRKNRTPAIYELQGCRALEDDDDFRGWPSVFEVTFSVCNREDVYQKPFFYQQASQNNSISKDDLKQAIAEVMAEFQGEDEDVEEDRSRSVVGYISDIVRDESLRQGVISMIGSIISMIKGMNQVNNVLPAQQVYGVSNYDEVLRELEKFDDNLYEDLKRLLRLARENKATFDFLISQLRQIQV